MIATERLILYHPLPEDAPRVLDYFQRNREAHREWFPPRSETFFSLGYWRLRLEDELRQQREGEGAAYYLLERDEPGGPIIGQCAFTQIVRGPFLACYLGYSLDAERQGRGYMGEALQAGIRQVFEAMGLHRIMANYRPENARSARVLKRLGFEVEGYARDYLFIDGAWRDHILTALTNPKAQKPELPGG